MLFLLAKDWLLCCRLCTRRCVGSWTIGRWPAQAQTRRRVLKPLVVIVPVFDEEGVVAVFHEQLLSVLQALDVPSWSVLYVDDGSTDNTPTLLERLAEDDQRVGFLRLTRNFGHQVALTAGLDHVGDRVVITMDGDGQHPPEMIPDMLNLYRAGHELVVTQRMDEGGGLALKRWTSNGFYWLVGKIADSPILRGAADYRLMGPSVVEAITSMREHHRFFRGLIAWSGYKPVILPYVAKPRLGGRSKYTWRKMLKLALDAIFSFSLVPLRLGIFLGMFFLLLAVMEVLYVTSFWIRGLESTLAPGWSSLMFMMLIVGGITMIILSIIGLYVGYIFQEVKRRPVYIVDKIRASSLTTEAAPEDRKNPAQVDT